MPRKIKFTHLSNAYRMYKRTLSLPKVAAHYGIGETTLRRIFEQANLPVRCNTAIVLPEQIICDAYVSGQSELALAKKHHVSRNVITRILTRHSIPRRGITQAQRLAHSRLTIAERKAMTRRANEAARGRKLSESEQIKHALTYYRTKRYAVPVETELAQMLTSIGLAVEQQFPVGPYNVDVSIQTPPIAVEIFGGGWHSYGNHAARHCQRTKYLLDLGWSVVAIWVDAKSHPLRPAVADYLIAFANQLGAHPPARGEYRVVWGDGKLPPVHSRYLNDPATIERLSPGN